MLALLAVALVAILLTSAEFGFRMGRRRRQDDPTVVSQASTWEGVLLGLLALLIGFTFAMAVSRFDGRRELIRSEANAIEQTMLRADILDPPQRGQVKDLLRRYLDARIRFYDAGMSLAGTEQAQREAVHTLRQLWAQAAALSQSRPDSDMAALFVESSNELIEAGANRRASLDNHVPFVVLIVLIVVAAVGVAATGYGYGLYRRRLRFGMLLLPVLISAVVLLVIDLDYPRAGVAKAGQGAMLRLRQGQSTAVP